MKRGKLVRFRVFTGFLLASLFLSPAVGGSTIVMASCLPRGLTYFASVGGGYGGRPGGIALDKAATFLTDMSDVKGAYYDQATNRIVFVGPKLGQGQTPVFNKDDLATAIRAVVFNNTVPTVNIGDPNNPTATTQPVTYGGGIENTNMGYVLEKADYDLKKYGIGYDSSGQKVTSTVPGYSSFFDRFVALNPTSGDGQGMSRVWISPKDIKLKFDSTSNSFVFDQVTMQVQAEIMPGSSQKYSQAVTGFAQHMDTNFDAFAQEDAWFSKTKDLSKIVGVVKWVKDSGIVSDFNWAKNYKPAYVATPATVQFYQTPSQNGWYQFGGISYSTPNTYNTDNGTSSSMKTVSQSAAPSELSDHWTFTQNSQTYQSVAVSANAFRAAGTYATQSTDLSIDTVGDNNLEFSRTYGSTASTTGEIGTGWEYVPARLLSTNTNVGVLCYPPTGYQGIYQQKLVFQTLDGIYETFTYSCQYGQYLPDKIEFNSTVKKETDGTYSVLTKDQRTYKFAAGVFLSEYPVQQVSDRNSNKITYQYGTNGLMSAMKDDQNRTVTINRNSNNVITSVSDWSGRAVTYGYDASGNLTSVTDPRGKTATYTYDSKGRLRGTTDRQNRAVLSNTYNDDNKIVSTTSAAGLVTTYVYDEPNKLVTATDANGRVSKMYYDSKMRVIKNVDPLNNYVEYTYGDQPVPLTVKDKNGNVTTYTYNDWADELSITYPNGKQITKQYNGFHYITNVTDSRYGTSPKVTSITYDTKGNKLSENEAGVTKQYTYDTKGNVLTTKDGLNQQTTNTYDTFGHVLTSTSATSATATNTYDSLGRLTQTVDASSKTLGYTYDANNNIATTTDASGTTTNTYSNDNKLTKVVTPDNRTTEFAYNAAGAQTSTKDALLNSTNYGYDRYKNLISRQDALNRTTQYQYDAMNRQKQSTTPLGKVAKWEYDANGNLTKRIDESNRATTYAYDSLNRLTTITYPDSSTVTNTYDDRGNLISTTNSTGTSTYAYNVFDRITSETDPNGNAVSYSYDNAGNMTTVTYPDNKVVTYTYDASNRLASVTDWNNQSTTYQYNGNGTLSSKQLPNGVIATYGYDGSNRVASLQYTKNSALITRFNYERDPSGDITRETETKDAPAQLPAANLSLYGDSLSSTWNTYSSYNVVFNTADAPAYQGTSALSYASNAWGYAAFKPNSGSLDTTPYSAISFAAKAGQVGQKVYLMMRDNNNAALTKIDISIYGGNLSSSGYKVYTIPLTALNASNKQIKTIEFSNELSNNSQPKIYLDNIKFTTDSANPALIYDDQLTSSFTSYPWSGATVDYNEMTSPYSGSKAIGLNLTMYGGLLVFDYYGINTAGYQSISFAIKGSAANQDLAVQVSNGGPTGDGPELKLSNYGGYLVNGSYKVYTIPISSLVPPNGMINGFMFKNITNQAQPKILIDEIKLKLPDASGTQRIATYTYDALGRNISANQPDGKSYSYIYDAVGNRLTSNENGAQSTQTYNNDNQLTAKGSRTFTYDNQGNQTGDGSKTLTFDYDNRLKTWNNPSPATSLSFLYDGRGNRIGKAGGGATHQFVNSTSGNLSKVLVDKNTTTSSQALYVYGDALLSQGGAATASRQYYLTDATGNVRYVTDNAGASLQAYTYDPYGNEITTSTLSNYGFQGYEKDRESNLSYLRARYYDPTTGRFISRDPVDGTLKVPESQNGYSYAHNDPVNLSDPSGEFIDTLWDAGNVLYDVYQCQWLDAAFDTGAAFIPFVPAGSTKALRALGAAGDAAKNIPGNPLRGPNAPAEAYKLLQKNHGIDPHTASNRLHKIKANGGVGAADNVVIGRTGDVYNERTGEFIGSLTDPKWGK